MEITKLLKDKLGEAYTAEIDKAVKEQLKAEQGNYVSKIEYNNKLKELAELKSKLEEQSKANETTMTLQEKYNKIKAEHEKAKQEYANNLNNLRLDNALGKSGAKNMKALKALLNNEKITYEQDGSIKGLDEQIEALKKSDSYLFDTANEKQGVGGFSNVSNNEEGAVIDFSKYMTFTPKTNNVVYTNNNKGDNN